MDRRRSLKLLATGAIAAPTVLAGCATDDKKTTAAAEPTFNLDRNLANSNAQPLYIFVDREGKVIINAGGYEPGIERFKKILEDVKAEFKKRFP